MTKSARILELDVLRGLAALAVVLFHFTHKYNEEFGHEGDFFLFKHGHYGVHLFFMISGYVIFMTVDHVKSMSKFIWLRFTRLFPVYWSSIILTYLIVNFFTLPGREVSWKAFLFNFTMIQDLFAIPSVDGAYWSLLPELMFYVLMAILIFIGAINKIRLINIIWLGLIISNKWINYPEILVKILNIQFGLLFIAGIQFYLITKSKSAYNYLILGFSWLVALFSFTANTEIFIITIFYIIFLALSQNWLSFLKSKTLIFLGAISYPLYLTHQNIGYVILNKLNYNFWLEISLTLIITIGIGAVIHYGIEKPVLKYLRTKIKLS